MPTTLESSRSTFWPPSFAVDNDGNLYVVNGLDRGDIWNGYDATSKNLGVDAPTVAPTITTPVGGACTAGDYVCYYRYKTGDGRYSNLSPVTTVTAAANDQISWDTVPNSSDARVTQIELLRSTSGESTVLYLITTITQPTAAYTADTSSDATLVAGTAYPILNGDGTVNLNRFTPPPDKAVCVPFYDRMFYAVDVIYDEGHAAVTNASTSITGRGTAWTSRMKDRKIWFAGDTTEYNINAATATAITLGAVFGGTTELFQPYSIRAARAERNTVYYSRAGEPESVPATSYIRLQENGDILTGLMPLGNYLYALQYNHIFRITMATQGACVCIVAQPVAPRGCVNQHCWATVEDVGYLLDHHGIHRVTSGGSEHISTPIQDIFRGKRLNWNTSKWWFASVDPGRETIRFHVTMGGTRFPKHAICYQYRLDKWWIEEVPWGWGGFCLVPVSGVLRPFFGGQYATFHTQGNNYDGPTQRTILGTATAAGALTITDTSSDAVLADANIVGNPISIVRGRGKGQTRRIVSIAASVITVDRPWFVQPDTTSEYQIGGVPWSLKSKTFAFIEDDRQTQRKLELVTTPTVETAYLDVRRYLDQNTTPENYGDIWDNGDGVVTEEDVTQAVAGNGRQIGPDANVALARTQTKGEHAGYRWHRIDGRTGERNLEGRYMQLELRGVKGTDPVEIHELSLSGVE